VRRILIFDMADSAVATTHEVIRPPIPEGEWEQPEMLAAEKETLGLFLSNHPLKPVAGALRARVDCSIADLDHKKDGDWLSVGGMIVESKTIRTKNGSSMMFARIDDLTAQVEIIVFAKALDAVKEHLHNDAIVTVRGRIDHKDGEVKLVAQEVAPFEPTEEELAASAGSPFANDPIRLVINADTAEHPSVAAFVRDIHGVVDMHKGPLPLEIVVRKGDDEIALECGDAFNVSRSSALVAELEGIEGVQVDGGVPAGRA
jgi:DNA polymerase-3 subunit alpha